MNRFNTAACLLLVALAPGIAAVDAADQANRTLTWHIVAEVDGSDRLMISEQETLWIHRHWAWPARVTINDVAWQPQGSPALPEKAHRQLLTAPVDFASARLAIHQGRDTAVLETFDDHIVIHLVDSPNGAAIYDLTVTFDLCDEPPQLSSGQAHQRPDPTAGLIGLASIDRHSTNVAFRYHNGKVLAPALLEHVDLPSGPHVDGIQIEFYGELRLPKELTVRVRHAGGSSTRGYATLSIDGKVIETLGDDRKKMSEQLLELAGGPHAIRWQIEGGDIGHCMLELADAATGGPLPLFHTYAMRQKLLGKTPTRIVDVQSRNTGWPIPQGWQSEKVTS